MIIETIDLTNFRAFAGTQRIHLHPRLNVLAGANGAGKSSLLDLSASLLSGFVDIVAGKGSPRHSQGVVSNINENRDQSQWAMTTRVQRGGLKLSVLWMTVFRDPDAQRRWTKHTGDNSPDWTLVDAALDADRHGLPPFFFAPSSNWRTPIHRTEKGIELKDRHIAWRGALDSEAHHLHDLHAWFEQEENIENQEKIKRGSFAYELPSLRAVRAALKRCLRHLHGCTLGEVSVLRQHSGDPLKPAAGRLFIKKGDRPLFFDQLSDGERRLLSIVLDLARRMVILNPQLNDPTQAEGVLLIDEIELHLHPQWQRTVVGAMVAAFPEMQLLLSTHSPLVLASVQNDNILVLDDGKVLSSTPNFSGRDPNTILTGPMSTPLRPDDVQRSLDALYRLIDQSPRKAKKPLKDLEKKLGDDDPDLVRARALLSLLEG